MNPPPSERATRNLAALREHHPHLLELLAGSRSGRFTVETRPSGEPAIMAACDRGVRRVGLPSPEATRRWLWEQPLEQVGCGTLFALGMADGAHLPLLAQRVSPHAEVFVLEPSAELAALVLETSDLASFLSRPGTHLMVGDLPDLVRQVAEQLSPARLEDHPVRALAHPDLAWLSPGFAGQAEAELLYATRLFSLEITTDLLEHRYIVEHTLENALLYAEAPDVAELSGILEGQTVMLLSDSPALEEALPLLSRYRHRVVAIASAPALRACLLGGVVPDLVVGVDPMPEGDRHFHQLEMPEDLLFVLEPRVLPMTWRRVVGRVFGGVLSDPSGGTRGTDAAGAWLARTLGGRGELSGRGHPTLALAALAVQLGAGAVLVLEPDRRGPPARPRDEETRTAAAQRGLVAFARSLTIPVRCVARGADWPGLPGMSLAEALTGSWADSAGLQSRMRGILQDYQPSGVSCLLEELDAELYHAGDYPIASLAGVLALLAMRARWEAERMRLAARLAPGAGRRAELFAAAAAREEQGLSLAHRDLRLLLSRLRRRLARRARVGGRQA